MHIQKELFQSNITDANQLELLEEYKNGNENVINDLIKLNSNLVIYIINNKFSSSYYDINELFSVGLFGLYKGIKTFDHSKKYQPSTYYGVCIKNEILMFLRKNQKHTFNYSIEENEIILKHDDKVLEKYEEKELLLILKEVLEKLPIRDKKIIEMYYGLKGISYTQDVIAKECQLSQSLVSRKIKSITKKLKVMLNDNIN